MKKNLFITYAFIIIAPIVLNYGLFTWRAPFVFGDSGSWLSFFASYLGLIGAITISVMQFKIQKDRDTRIDRESNRSYITAQEFRSPFNLKNVITNENSRIILNEYYNEAEQVFELDYIIEKKIKNQNINLREFLGNINIQFYKIKHSGLPDIIINCQIYILVSDFKKTAQYEIRSNIGTVTKFEEIFIPIVNLRYREITPLEVKVTYTTIKGEDLKYIYRYEDKEELHMLKINTKRKEKFIELHSIDVSESTWIYPSQIIRDN